MSSDNELPFRVPKHSCGAGTPARLPDSGPARARPAPEAVVILIVIIVSVLWLLGRGYSAAAAIGILALAARQAAYATRILARRAVQAR
jgi:hypothetical protein